MIAIWIRFDQLICFDTI